MMSLNKPIEVFSFNISTSSCYILIADPQSLRPILFNNAHTQAAASGEVFWLRSFNEYWIKRQNDHLLAAWIELFPGTYNVAVALMCLDPELKFTDGYASELLGGDKSEHYIKCKSGNLIVCTLDNEDFQPQSSRICLDKGLYRIGLVKGAGDERLSYKGIPYGNMDWIVLMQKCK